MDKNYLIRGNDTPLAVCLRKREGEGDPVPYDLSTAERMRLALVGHGTHVFAVDIAISGEDDNIVSGVIPGRSLLKGDYDLEVTFTLDGRDKRFAVKDMFEAVDFLAEDADGEAEGEGAGIFVTVTVQPELIEIAGPTGPQGKSAYQVWLDDGHTGTEDDFFEWLAAQTPNPDWEQNDSSKTDYIKNRTHWEEESSTTINDAKLAWSGSTPEDLDFWFYGTNMHIPRTSAGWGLTWEGGELFIDDMGTGYEIGVFDGEEWEYNPFDPSFDQQPYPLNVDVVIASQTVHKLDNKFLDMDSEPTTGSGKPVTSGGVKAAIADFVTRAVNDLLNYYTKTETYTKAEVNQLVAGINNWEIVPVAQLPEASADTMHKIYLVPSSNPKTKNVKDEFITVEVSGAYSWEQIGTTAIDLTNYVTKQELTAALADYVTSTAFTQALATKQDKIDAQHKLDYSLLDNTPEIPDPSDFATKEEVSQLRSEVGSLDQEVEDILGLPTVVINVGAYDVVIGTTYQTEYRCEGAYGTNHRSRFVPVGNYKGRTIRIVAESSTKYVGFCAVTQQPSLEHNSNLAFATGWTESVRVETQQDFIVPADAEYFIMYYGDIRYPNTTHDPVSMTVLGKDSAAVLKDQGIANAGKFMVVGNDGKVVPVAASPTPPEDAVKVVPTKTLYLGEDIAAIGTLGTGWSGSVAQGFTHASGNTDPLVLNTTTEGKAYLVTIINSVVRENAYDIAIGDGVQVDPYDGQLTTRTGLVSDGGAVKVTPVSSYEGTIKVAVQEVVDEEDAEETIELAVNNVEADNMEAAITAFWNVAIGPSADTLGKNVNATRNIAIGVSSLRELVSGSRNIGIGTFAMRHIESGKGNIAIGADALFQRTKGDDNIAIGRAAVGGGSASVIGNVCIGLSAGSQVSGDNNVCIGNAAGYNATKDSIYIGLSAGFSYTGLNNIFIGRQAGYISGTRTGNWNIAIGASAQIANNCSKSTAIGYQASADKSSQCVIGGADCVETKLSGDVVVRGTDSVLRKLVFNNDNTVTWESVA